MTAPALASTNAVSPGVGRATVAAALSLLGTPYWFGRPLLLRHSKPAAVDCSGLVVWSIYQATGRKLIHSSETLYRTMRKRPYSAAQPGDVVFFGKPIVHHCGIYLGGGQMVEAPDWGIPVRVSSVAANPARLRSEVGYLDDAGASSAPPPSLAGLDTEQQGNAGLIFSMGAQLGATARDIAVAIMTALDESGLRNLPGGDRDSAGLFQQRPSQGWGSYQQITTPSYSISRFFNALLAVPNRDQQDPWMEAQDVQHSGDPSGSNYQAFWNQAQSITTAEMRYGAGTPSSGLQGITGGAQLASAQQDGFNWLFPLGSALGGVAGGVMKAVGRIVLIGLFVVGGVVMVVLGAKNAAQAKPSTNVVIGG